MVQVVTQAPAPPSPVPAGATQRPTGGGQTTNQGTAPAATPAAPKSGSKKPGGKGKPSAFQRARTAGPGWSSLKPTSPMKPPNRVADAGGFLTGLALYTVVVIYVRYGAAGWKGWLSAKFLNKPMASSTSGSAATKPTTKNGGTAAV